MKQITRRKLWILIPMAIMLAFIVYIPATGAVWTDKPDYKPGETVTISGASDEVNQYLPGETVEVMVYGQNDYQQQCLSTDGQIVIVAGDGTWSCQVALFPDERAIGGYVYTANGLTSGTHEEGTFTDSAFTRLVNLFPGYGACGTTITVQARLESSLDYLIWNPLAGQTVNFTLGTSTGSGISGPDGMATATLQVPNAATQLVASYTAADSCYCFPFGCFCFPGQYYSSSSSIPFTASCGGNMPPVANAGAPYYGGYEGSAIPLNGSGSYDPEGTPLTYAWTADTLLCSFDDAASVTPNLTCTDQVSPAAVTLVVSDGVNTASAITYIYAYNSTPTAAFNAPVTFTEGEPFTLSFANPYDPSPVDTSAGFRYYFDCGDGVLNGPFSSSSYTCTPGAAHFIGVGGDIQDKDGDSTHYTNIIVGSAPTNLPEYGNHYYELASVPVSWDQANGMANAAEFGSCSSSHLVTITSQKEQDALYSFYGASLSVKYYGGYQTVFQPPNEGWAWVTGEPWGYTNWDTGEPNDWAGVGSEQYLMGWNDPYEVEGRGWNDSISDGSNGFVIEYEGCNQPPVASAGGPYLGDEGAQIGLDGSGSADPDGDPLTYSWMVDSLLCSFDDATLVSPNLTCSDNGNFSVTLTVNDGLEEANATAAITINNVSPVVNIDSVEAVLVPVGTPVSASGSFTDPGLGDAFSATWEWGDASTSSGSVNGFDIGPDSHAYANAGVYTIVLTIADDDDGIGSASYQYVVVYDPSAGFVTGGGWITSPVGAYHPPDLPYFGGSYYRVVSDPLDWTDASTAASMSELGWCSSAHLATITSQEEQDALYNFFGGDTISFAWLGAHLDNGEWKWITGEPWDYTNWQEAEPSGEDENALMIGGGGTPIDGGWIYDGKWNDTVDINPQEKYIIEYEGCNSSKATFGFVSKYQKGSNMPTGNTEFQFHIAGFNFHSTSYEWLVVTGSNYARFKGEGTINGMGLYKFMIWAGDGTGPGGADTFRIKIWMEEGGIETVIYDNRNDLAISSGSIVVHSK